MTVTSSSMRRPQRWDQPFDPHMTDALAAALLNIAPFSQMDPNRFPPRIPLLGILRNDCRYVRCQPGEIIVREGDYGNSAFLLVEGSASATVERLPNELLGRAKSRKLSWWESVSQLWSNPKMAEVRNTDLGNYPGREVQTDTDSRVSGHERTSIFIQDLPRVLISGKSAKLVAGDLFGEMAALTRTPRTATVIAESSCDLIEIRWQGLRELLKYDVQLKSRLNERYRQNSLNELLRATPLLRGLSDQAIDEISEAATFGTWGPFDWNHQFQKVQQCTDDVERIEQEPLIVCEGDYPNGLIFVRSGFVRLSKKHGVGHRTFAYLGKGAVYGVRELYHNWRCGKQHPLLLSLRAIGYVDTIHLPTEVAEKWILPNLPVDQIPAPISDSQGNGQRERRQHQREDLLETSLLEFLLENRLINGTQAMLVDRNRCTRCDDCVRACATAHAGNPRFVRSGLANDNWMIAHACMHCMDPVCMIGCPTGAIGRDEATGVIRINDSTCIGCGTCANSCPYQNIQMVPIRNVQGEVVLGDSDQQPIMKATKCDLCLEQLGGPACQRACPHDALVRIDLTAPGPLAKFLKGAGV
ncbi:MAG TPA: cyclic nucleotide-binding domain-containing protein [Pirellulaceae bacterium]|nr:cyclic nucleotide-binding domain-containing protein [Pirellulaceae bacterium]